MAKSYEKFYPSLTPQPAAPTWSFPLVTLLLVGSTIAVFWQQVHGLRSDGVDELASMYDFSPEKWNGPAWWTIFTYAWIHLANLPGSTQIYWPHIVSNMIALICVGPALEELLGHFSYLILYLGGAAAGALTWMFFGGSAVVDPQFMGASGAIFAVLVGLATAGRGVKVTTFIMFVIPVRVRADLLAVGMLIFEVLALPVRSPIAHTCHLGGAAFGFLYVLLFHQLLGRSQT